MPFGAPSADACVERLSAFGLNGTPIAGPFPMWLVAMPARPRAQLMAILSERERIRGARFCTSALRRRYWAAHGALRLLGELSFGTPAAGQQYETGTFGKPRLAGGDARHCSISYSGNEALVAWAG